MSQQPSVPDSLRALAQRGLVAGQTPRLHSLRWHLRRLAESARGMQQAIMARARPPGTLPFVDGGWQNGGDWSRLLADFDHAIAALRAAWQALKDSEAATQQVLATWRVAYGIPADERIDEDSEAFWLLLLPALEKAREQTIPLLETALAQYGAVTTPYFQLLCTSQPVSAFGPQLSSKPLSRTTLSSL